MSFCRAFALTLAFISFPCVGFPKDVTFRVLGIQQKPLLQTSAPLHFRSLGELTHSILEEALTQKILTQYNGTTEGVVSINDLGGELEVLSSTQMDAYGWCFRVDGVIPNSMADKTRLTGNESVIEWFYAYAHLNKNDWTAMCIPADHKPSEDTN